MMAKICGAPLDEALVLDGFCADELPVDVDNARSVFSLGTSDMIILERGKNRVSFLADTDGDNVADSVQEVVVPPNNDLLTHGLAVNGGYLYASSSTTVYRWPFDTSNPILSSSQSVEVLINNMNADGNGGAPLGHWTRTLAFDAQGRLYVSIGSSENVDPNSFRSRIRRFSLDSSNNFPIDFATGEVFADGLRNEVGLAFDKHGILWGVENGADKLRRNDLGGDITEDNPAEELNRFPEELAGQTWGYPYCWSEFSLPPNVGMGRNSVWAWPSFVDDGVHTDEWCRANTHQSELSMQAHSAPLGITFYNYHPAETLDPSCAADGGTFPAWMDGYAFIAHHGSWNRDVPTGYKIVAVEMNADGRVPNRDQETAQPFDLLAHIPPNAQWPDGFKPVDVDFDACGRLLVTSDGTRNHGGSKVVRLVYTGDSSTTEAPRLIISEATNTMAMYYGYLSSNASALRPSSSSSFQAVAMLLGGMFLCRFWSKLL
jgi:glucose/arabinose dehydrogenase